MGGLQEIKLPRSLINPSSRPMSSEWHLPHSIFEVPLTINYVQITFFLHKKLRSLNSNWPEASGLTAWLILDGVPRRGNLSNVMNPEGFSKSKLDFCGITYALYGHLN